jgi:hypothetical protein
MMEENEKGDDIRGGGKRMLRRKRRYWNGKKIRKM